MKKWVNSAIIFPCFVFFSFQCSQTENSGAATKAASEVFQNINNKDSLIICWDPPAENADSIASYELLFHTSKQSSWTTLKQDIAASNSPSSTVFRKDVGLGDSIFYFAVRAVAKNGLKSNLHTSSDETASPPNWCVLWD